MKRGFWMRMLTAAALFALGGCFVGRGGAGTSGQPVVLDGLSGHQAVVIPKDGDYPLESPLFEEVGHPGPQLALTPGICKFADIKVVGPTKEPVARSVPGPEQIQMRATLRISKLKRPIVVGYDFRYARVGPLVVALDGGQLPCL